MEASAYEAGHASGQSFVIGLVAVALLGGGIFFVIAMIKATKHRTRGWIIGAIAAGLVALCGLLGAAGLAAGSLGRAIESSKSDAGRKKRLTPDEGRHRVEVSGSSAKAVPPAFAGDTRSQVVRIVVELLGTDPAEVHDAARFIEDLGADSLDAVELVMAVEEEFEVAIPDETAEKLATVGELIRWIDGQKGAVEK